MQRRQTRSIRERSNSAELRAAGGMSAASTIAPAVLSRRGGTRRLLPPTPLAAGGLCLLLIAGCSAVAWRGDSRVVRAPGRPTEATAWTWVFIALLAAGYAAYVLGLAVLRHRRVGLVPVAVLAVAIQLAPVAAPLVLSADAWVYWDYGRIAAVHHRNPYTDPPADEPADPAYGHVPRAWRDSTSVYGPAFTLASEPIALAAGGSPDAAAWLYKAMAGLAVLVATACAAFLSRRRAFAIAFVGWNPLLAIHFGGGGHNDAAAAALVAGALVIERARRPALAGAAWVVSAATKWLSLALLPIHLLGDSRRPRRAFGAGLLLTAAGLAVVAGRLYGRHWLGALGPLAHHAAAGSHYSLVQRLEETGVPHGAALAATGVAFAAGYAWLLLQAHRGRPRLGLTALLVLVASPWLLPWYVVWPVVLVAAEDDPAAQLLALCLCAYLLPQRILV